MELSQNVIECCDLFLILFPLELEIKGNERTLLKHVKRIIIYLVFLLS